MCCHQKIGHTTYPFSLRSNHRFWTKRFKICSKKNAIESVYNTKGFFSSMFTVPQKDGGWRPTINLKCLNAYLAVSHFKMEGIGSLKDVLQEGDFMGKIDLEDAYLSVPVHLEHRDFLKFSWRRKIYQFRPLPFGLATAPRVFTKILWPLAPM